ncbi:DUF72 domain-containing protein [Rhizobacter sp. Root1221]|uniref:DUF72 domain-containing protein n=1 Tax=Rhizobacter sp. Root1221 TaxID=1736433 RepID=UPI000700A253|nr:DUF72 domain-containing protein [Rhizobacter sp. Root1221]KQW03053.1 hypothetical protein ASC87_01585 [Rhizobacter sp. Root1221]
MPVLVGTASWTDKTLIDCGRFYPPHARTPEGRLRHYASVFPLVEVDSSYYAMPTPANAQRWAERTPDTFTMNVKSFRLFTGHQTSPTVLHKDIQAQLGPAAARRQLYYKDVPPALRDELWRRFIEALAPLKAAGRLGLVHFQFPPWVRCGAAGRSHVAHCVEHMAGHTVSVEFRHASWFAGGQADETLAFERDLAVVHTVVDEPQGFDNSVPAVWARSHPAGALVRLHGRNAGTWNLPGGTASSDRFNYDYPDNELEGLAANIRQLSLDGVFTHVVFNNNMEDQGQRNAKSLMAILGI